MSEWGDMSIYTFYGSDTLDFDDLSIYTFDGSE
jgi:hypothetical protein